MLYLCRKSRRSGRCSTPWQRKICMRQDWGRNTLRECDGLVNKAKCRILETGAGGLAPSEGKHIIDTPLQALSLLSFKVRQLHPKARGPRSRSLRRSVRPGLVRTKRIPASEILAPWIQAPPPVAEDVPMKGEAPSVIPMRMLLCFDQCSSEF